MSDTAQLWREIEKINRILERLRTAEGGAREGTWTPGLLGSGTAGSFTYGAGNGAEYTRIGDRILINGRLQITATAVAPVGNLSITGLPFTAGSSASVIAGGIEIFNWATFNVAAGYTDIGGQILNGTTTIGIVKNGDNLAPAYVQGSEAAATLDLQFFGHYRVSS